MVGSLLENQNQPEPGLVSDLWAPRGKEEQGLRLWITRDLERAKRYVAGRYSDNPDARFGLLASSRDQTLPDFGVQNGFQATKILRVGPWFADGEENIHSCRHMRQVVTEFQAQGLELDMALLCWGTDWIRNEGKWTDRWAKKYAKGDPTVPKDPAQMRRNAYRVLLTRGRDGTIVYVPKASQLDETYDHLCRNGFRKIDYE